MVAKLFLLALIFWMAPAQSRMLGKSAKDEKVEEIELPQDLVEEEFEEDLEDDEEDRILPDDDTDLCLDTLTVYSDPDDLFFDEELMQVVMLDVSH